VGLLRSDGSNLNLSAADGADLYRATVGGMGLTGIISFIELTLVPIRSAFLDVEHIAFSNIKEFFELAAQSVAEFEHTVAWLDCATSGTHFGRGIFERGRWCDDGDLKPHRASNGWGLPVEVPGFVLNRLTIRLLNTLYYQLQASRKVRRRVH